MRRFQVRGEGEEWGFEEGETQLKQLGVAGRNVGGAVLGE